MNSIDLYSKINPGILPSFYIKSIEFRNGMSIPLIGNDIVVFVGPNNGGKTQCLKDIRELITNEGNEGVIIKSIDTLRPRYKDLLTSLDLFYSKDSNGNYSGIGEPVFQYPLSRYNNENFISKGIRDFVSAWLNNDNRLSNSNAAPLKRSNESKKHAFHYLEEDPDLTDSLNAKFEETFHTSLNMNSYSNDNLSFRIGKRPDYKITEKNPHHQYRIIKEALDELPLLDTQGDGMRSFVSILSGMMVPHYEIFFIDEPEAFLHPPQAYKIGNLIPTFHKNLKKQLFVATHSEEVLKGIIDSGSNRVMVIRISRKPGDKENQIAIIENSRFKSVWDKPLLRYSNIMQSIFYPTTIVCEAEADCMFYKRVHSIIYGDNSEVLFISAHDKYHLGEVAEALSDLKIDYRIVPDFDILNDEHNIKKLFENCGGSWGRFESKLWQILDKSLHCGEKNKSDLKDEIDDYLNGITADNLTDRNVTELRDIMRNTVPKWRKAKEKGIYAFKNQFGERYLNLLLDRLHDRNIYPLEYGEMESLHPYGSRCHSYNWVDRFLKAFPHGTEPVYSPAISFVKSWQL